MKQIILHLELQLWVFCSVFYCVTDWTQLPIAMKILVIMAKITSKSYYSSFQLVKFLKINAHFILEGVDGENHSGLSKDHLQVRCSPVVWFYAEV